MRTILVGFDGSVQAKRAARVAADLATRDHAEVRLVDVVVPVIIPNEYPAMPVLSLVEDQLKAAEEDVQSFAKELAAQGTNVTTQVVRGAPAAELLRMCGKSPDVDLMVVGRAGKGAIARAVMGSVSSRLAHECPKPLMVIP